MHLIAMSAVALVLSASPLSAQEDSVLWADAAALMRRIATPTPLLTEIERRGFRDLHARLRTERTNLRATESNLVAALTATGAALRAHRDSTAEYQRLRALYRDSLEAYNARCDRKFTDPSAVVRCDAVAKRLQSQRDSLDRQEAAIAARSNALQATQAENAAAVERLDQRGGAWSAALRDTLTLPLRALLDEHASTATLRLTAKSFIRTIDLSSMSAEARPRAERTFAFVTNRNFSENPGTPSPDSRDYRLWSQVNVIAGCRGSTLTAWRTSLLAHRGGKELGILDAETRIMKPLQTVPAPSASVRGGADSLRVSYAIDGKPNDAALASFRWVNPRTCDYIWHQVEARVSCTDGKAVIEPRVTGSRFPTHRAWTGDQERATVEQGPFSNLWNCDASAPQRVQ